MIMEIKLFVRTHKKSFGSVIYYSKNLKSDEKEKLENIKYTDYEPDITEIIEITRKDYSIYFITFIGGKDEYGREYQSVISTIFPFQLSVQDLLNLKKMFNDIIADMIKDRFSIDNKYFADIKGVSKDRYSNIFSNETKESKFNLLKGNLFIWLLVFVLILTFSFLFLKNLSNSKLDKKVSKYKKFIEQIESEENYVEKYKIYNEFLKEEEKEAEKYLEKLENYEYEKIIEFMRNNPNEIERTIEMIEEYINNGHKIVSLKRFEDLKVLLYKNFEENKYVEILNKIKEYNEKPNLQKLKDVEKTAENYLKEKNIKKELEVKNYINNIKNIINGINTELEIRIEGNANFNDRRNIEFVIVVDKENEYRKQRKISNTMEKDMYIGTYNGKVKLDSQIEIKIYEIKDNNRILIFNFITKYEDIEPYYVVKSDRNEEYFKFKLWMYGNRFNIKI